MMADGLYQSYAKFDECLSDLYESTFRLTDLIHHLFPYGSGK